MSHFVTARDGAKIVYEVSGDGPPVVLVHGFGSNRVLNWKSTLWYRTLTRAGHQVIALDLRGHGESSKPHESAAYEEGGMAADIAAVMDDLGLQAADVMGYSMGAFLTIRLMCDETPRVRRAVLAGVGENYFRVSSQTEIIAEGLLAA